MAIAAARVVHCKLRPPRVAESSQPLPPSSLKLQRPTAAENGRIVLQPRLCTLRSYGSDRMIRRDEGGDKSPFFEALSEYIENSKKSQDFEIISGRLAMIVFAATVVEEWVTGNSVFRKLDLLGIEEAGGACLAAVIFAAVFAWFSSARSRVGRIFTVGCNAFIESLIDQIVDGLFYESDISDWIDEV